MSKLLQNTTDLQAILVAINELPEISGGWGGESTVEIGEFISYSATPSASAPAACDYIFYADESMNFEIKSMIIVCDNNNYLRFGLYNNSVTRQWYSLKNDGVSFGFVGASVINNSIQLNGASEGLDENSFRYYAI